MTLIDLGNAGAATEAAAAPVNLPRLRRLALAVLTAVGLAAMTASTPPAPSLVRPLWATALQPSDTVAMDGRTVYLNRGSPSGPAEVVAYDLHTGRLRWNTPTGDAYGIRPVGGVVLVTTGPTSFSAGPRTIALDAATGTRLWQSAGASSASPVGSGVLLAETGQSGATTGLRLVGLRGGHQVWRRSITPAEEWTTLTEDGRPTSVVTVTATGDATVYDYDDGAVRHRSRIPWNGVYSATLFPVGAQLVDAATGRTIGRPLGGQEAFVAGPAGSLMLLRATGKPDDRTAVNRLDLADGRQTALGTIDRLAEQDCQGVSGYLLCPRGDTLTATAVG